MNDEQAPGGARTREIEPPAGPDEEETAAEPVAEEIVESDPEGRPTV